MLKSRDNIHGDQVAATTGGPRRRQLKGRRLSVPGKIGKIFTVHKGMPIFLRREKKEPCIDSMSEDSVEIPSLETRGINNQVNFYVPVSKNQNSKLDTQTHGFSFA